MNQKELKELESRCIQEEAPPCTARCPLHVDVRGFLSKAALARWNDALQVLAITMPFPTVLARICDHPCETACKREEAGGAIAIGAIERAVAESGSLARRRMPLPRKQTRVAVVGGGLSGITVAWDLSLKGYNVTVHQKGTSLGSDFGEGIVASATPQAVEKEMTVLVGMGVKTLSLPGLPDHESVRAIRAEYDAVYVDTEEAVRMGLSFGADDLRTDPFTLAAREAGIFASGEHGQGGAFSPIRAVALGRRAAVSIDRFLQKVSPTAGREKEGPYETRLYVGMMGVEARPRIAPGLSGQGYTADEAKQEAGRCLRCECMECVKVCVFLERFKSYPKQYVRQISNNETIVLGNHGPINRLINSCSLCGLCAEVCPTDLSMGEICMEARRSLVVRGKMPPSAHEFALEDMASADSPGSAFASHEPGRDKSAFAFFPGCQLGAASPDHVIDAYNYLRGRLEGGVGLMVRCCGAPAEWAARDDLMREAHAGLMEDWETLGRPVMVVACPTCYKVFREHMPEMEVATLWQHLDGSGGAEWSGETLAVHDPCTTRHEPAMREAVRTVLKDMGCKIEELELSGDRTECCGFGGLMSTANRDLAREQAAKRASRCDTEYVTYCAVCRNSLAAAGKKVFHLLDLFFGRSSPELTRLADRRDCRRVLRERLVTELWGGEKETVNGFEGMALYIASPVWELLEERRILTGDLRRAIALADTGGAVFRNRETGRSLASLRTGHVTYWVEYAREGDGFRIYNAYSHRMEVATGKG